MGGIVGQYGDPNSFGQGKYAPPGGNSGWQPGAYQGGTNTGTQGQLGYGTYGTQAASDMQSQLSQQGAVGQQMGAPQADYGMANLAMGNQGATFGQQQANAAHLQAIANGTAGPSAAQNQIKAGVGAEQSAGQSAAASAQGGGAAFSAARRTAAQQAGAEGQQGANALAMQGAQDQQSAQIQLSQQLQQMQSGQVGAAQQGMAMGLGQGNLNAQNQQQQNQYQLGMEQTGLGYQQAQSGYQQNLDSMLQNQQQAQQQNNAQVQNAVVGGVTSAVGGGAAAAAKSDARNKRSITDLSAEADSERMDWERGMSGLATTRPHNPSVYRTPGEGGAKYEVRDGILMKSFDEGGHWEQLRTLPRDATIDPRTGKPVEGFSFHEDSDKGADDIMSRLSRRGYGQGIQESFGDERQPPRYAPLSIEDARWSGGDVGLPYQGGPAHGASASRDAAVDLQAPMPGAQGPKVYARQAASARLQDEGQAMMNRKVKDMSDLRDPYEGPNESTGLVTSDQHSKREIHDLSMENQALRSVLPEWLHSSVDEMSDRRPTFASTGGGGGPSRHPLAYSTESVDRAMNETAQEEPPPGYGPEGEEIGAPRASAPSWLRDAAGERAPVGIHKTTPPRPTRYSPQSVQRALEGTSHEAPPPGYERESESAAEPVVFGGDSISAAVPPPPAPPPRAEPPRIWPEWLQQASEQATGWKPGMPAPATDPSKRPMWWEKSDERAKGSVKRNPELMDFVDKLHPYSYEYKEPEVDGYGKRLGVMAQDIERSKLGQSMVQDTPHGKMVDTKQASLASLAVISDLNKRLEALEGRRAKP